MPGPWVLTKFKTPPGAMGRPYWVIVRRVGDRCQMMSNLSFMSLKRETVHELLETEGCVQVDQEKCEAALREWDKGLRRNFQDVIDSFRS